MPIIIDGWNFIRSSRSTIKDDDADSLESVRSLISHLNEFQITHADPLIVALDSSREFLGIAYKNSARLAIVATANADDYIKRYVDKCPLRQRRNVRVVSSDNDIYFYAKSCYATPIKSEEFWDKLR